MASVGRKAAVVSALFVLVLAIIANLAWATAVSITKPWYSPAVSLQMYTISLPLAGFVAVVLAASASGWRRRLDEGLRALDARVAALRGANPPAVESALAERPDPIDLEVEEVLRSLQSEVEDSAGRTEPAGHDVLLTLTPPTPQDTARVRMEVLVELVSQRLALRSARGRVWWIASGPILASVAFAGIAGAMLPGSEGFAVTHFQLNTTFILLLAYGWWIVVAWAVAALQLMHVGAERDLVRTRAAQS